jgi:hypothetical protein
MSGPGSARTDLCSIRTADEHEELGEAVRGGFRADGYPLGSDDPTAPLTSGIDRAIRLSTEWTCSPWRASRRMSPTGMPTLSSGPTARPGSPPGSSPPRSTASSMPARWRCCPRPGTGSRSRPWPAGCSAWGIAATLMANMAQGWSHGLVGAVVAAWRAVSLVGSHELLAWLIRASGTAEHGPLAGHLGDVAACRAAARSARTAATGAGFPCRGERDTSDRARQPAARGRRAAGHPRQRAA